uniref:Integrase catalytic domain-containing protein n=1 Tax=Trichuris muris TaxID=70415 RepID=A0A5S6PZN3_TRIMR
MAQRTGSGAEGAVSQAEVAGTNPVRIAASQELFNGDGDWQEWISAFEVCSELNSWNSRLPEMVRRSFEAAKTALAEASSWCMKWPSVRGENCARANRETPKGCPYGPNGLLRTLEDGSAPTEEVFLDNDTAFRSRTFTDIATLWGTRVRYRCAHAPSGNGIAERCHRSVKVVSARKNCSIPEAVYLYNVVPRDDRTASSASAGDIYRYTVRIRGIDHMSKEVQPVDVPYDPGTSSG